MDFKCKCIENIGYSQKFNENEVLTAEYIGGRVFCFGPCTPAELDQKLKDSETGIFRITNSAGSEFLIPKHEYYSRFKNWKDPLSIITISIAYSFPDAQLIFLLTSHPELLYTEST